VAYLVAGQRGREPAHPAVLQRLGLQPLLDLRLRAGEAWVPPWPPSCCVLVCNYAPTPPAPHPDRTIPVCVHRGRRAALLRTRNGFRWLVVALVVLGEVGVVRRRRRMTGASSRVTAAAVVKDISDALIQGGGVKCSACCTAVHGATHQLMAPGLTSW